MPKRLPFHAVCAMRNPSQLPIIQIHPASSIHLILSSGSSSPYYPCLCLCFAFNEQMIKTVPGPFFPPFLLTDLHPSQSFLTELLVFIPLICSAAVSFTFTAAATTGRLPAAIEVDVANVEDLWLVMDVIDDVVGFGRRRQSAVRNRDVKESIVAYFAVAKAMRKKRLDPLALLCF